MSESSVSPTLSCATIRGIHANFTALPLHPPSAHPLQPGEQAFLVTVGHERYGERPPVKFSNAFVPLNPDYPIVPTTLVFYTETGAEIARYDLSRPSSADMVVHPGKTMVFTAKLYGYDSALLGLVHFTRNAYERAEAAAAAANGQGRILSLTSNVQSPAGAFIGDLCFRIMPVFGTAAAASLPALPPLHPHPFVLGHRGCGSDRCHNGKYTTVSENTLESYIAARRCGADGVEFDVQLTADGGLVVNHDFIAVCGITGHKYLIVESETSSLLATAPAACRERAAADHLSSDLAHRVECCNSNRCDHAAVVAECPTVDIPEVPLSTYTADRTRSEAPAPAAPAARPGSYRCSVGEVLQNTPEMMLNVEIKYPASGPARGRYPGPGILAARVLELVATMTTPHAIVFSTFDPWLAHALTVLQNRLPVLYLCCADPMNLEFDYRAPDTRALDPRENCMADAIEFVQTPSHGLAGMVAFTESLRGHPTLGHELHSADKALWTYGTTTNEAHFIMWQLQEAKVDGIIYDCIE